MCLIKSFVIVYCTQHRSRYRIGCPPPSTIRQLFLLTGAHKLHKNRDFRISGRLFRKKCAVHLDIRPRDTDEFLAGRLP